jgi:hypothetical protein
MILRQVNLLDERIAVIFHQSQESFAREINRKQDHDLFSPTKESVSK